MYDQIAGATSSAYVQDERYFAKEHRDVRREASQYRTALLQHILRDQHHPPTNPLGIEDSLGESDQPKK